MMVWTPDQTATFLQRAKYHRLYALYRLIAFAVWAPRCCASFETNTVATLAMNMIMATA
jgi:hypothetical protein